MRVVIGLFILGLLLVSGCSGTGEAPEAPQESMDEQDPKEEPHERTVAIDKLEVYHFHGNQQCKSCKTVGAYAEETVKTYFEDELESGKIVFDHINGDLPENKDLVRKYGATGSSLWLGVYDNDSFNAEQNKKVWYKIQDKQEYMQYLKGVIEQKLAGE